MGRIIAVANQKGGVGKTTTSGATLQLALKKGKVLAVDIWIHRKSDGLSVDKRFCGKVYL